MTLWSFVAASLSAIGVVLLMLDVVTGYALLFKWGKGLLQKLFMRKIHE